MTRIFATIAAAAAVAAAVPSAAAHRDPDAELSKLLAGRTAGAPVSCISLRSSQSSQVIDHRALVYRVGSTLYVNRPRSGADDLRSDDIVVTKTIGDELCSIDTVRLVDRANRFPHGFVILDKWVPYRLVKPARG